MTEDLITTKGRLRSLWDTDANLMVIRLESAVETWTEEPSPHDVLSLIERWHFDFKLTTEEVIWIMEQAQSWDRYATFAEGDLHRYGEIALDDL